MPQRVSIHFNAETDSDIPAADGFMIKPDTLRPYLRLPKAEASAEAIASAANTKRNWSTETAARQFLQALLENQGSEKLAFPSSQWPVQGQVVMTQGRLREPPPPYD